MTDDLARHPTVTLFREGDRYEVSIDPPLPGGDQRQCFASKDGAWGYAMRLWTDNRAAFDDRTDARIQRGAS